MNSLHKKWIDAWPNQLKTATFSIVHLLALSVAKVQVIHCLGLEVSHQNKIDWLLANMILHLI
jgi:hypothetical protein